MIDDHDLNAASPDVREQMLQRRPLHIATRETAVVVASSRRCPPLVALAADIGLAGFALRCERVEFLFEPFLGRFAGVDRAALMTKISPRHCGLPSAGRSEPALAGGEQIDSISAQRTAGPTTPSR